MGRGMVLGCFKCITLTVRFISIIITSGHLRSSGIITSWRLGTHGLANFRQKCRSDSSSDGGKATTALLRFHNCPQSWNCASCQYAQSWSWERCSWIRVRKLVWLVGARGQFMGPGKECGGMYLAGS